MSWLVAQPGGSGYVVRIKGREPHEGRHPGAAFVCPAAARRDRGRAWARGAGHAGGARAAAGGWIGDRGRHESASGGVAGRGSCRALRGIGRAACRERVEISVVAVSLKKKDDLAIKNTTSLV